MSATGFCPPASKRGSATRVAGKREGFLRYLKVRLLCATPGESICVFSPTPESQKQLLSDLAEEIEGSCADFTTVSVIGKLSGKPFDYGHRIDRTIFDDPSS